MSHRWDVILVGALSLGFLSACLGPNLPLNGSASEPVNSGIGSGVVSTGSGSLSRLPTQPSAVPTPSSNPSLGPSSSPSPSASASASANTAASANPGSEPTPSTSTSTSTSTSGKTVTVHGTVYEDTAVPLNDGMVQLRSLSETQPFLQQVPVHDGVYTIEAVPVGVQMELRFLLAGFTPRTQVVVAGPENQEPERNVFDFGEIYADGLADPSTSVSNKPEVTGVKLTQDATGVALDTRFVIDFSEPMDRETVEDNFGVYAASTVMLSIDDGVGISGPDENDEPHSLYGVDEDGNDLDSLGDMVGPNGTPAHPGKPETSLVWDKDAFEISWNADDTQVTFRFREGYRLPSDHELERVPRYLISFKAQDGILRDADGFRRDSDYFKLHSGPHEAYFAFDIPAENQKPFVRYIVADSNEDHLDKGNEVRVVFSEPLVYYTQAGDIRGNIWGHDADRDPLNPDNYLISVNDDNEVPWSDLAGAQAYVDSADESHQTVLLRSSEQYFDTSDDVTLRVRETVVDPAGNTFDKNQDEATDRAS